MVKKPVKKDEPLWKKSAHEKDARHKFLAIVAVMAVIIIIAIAIFIVTLPPVKRIIYSDLELDGIQVRRINDDYVDENTTSTDLQVVVYLTNNGKLDSGEIQIDAYIRSFDTRGVETPCNSNDTIDLGGIETDSTGKTTLNFTDLLIKQDEEYTIDFYIWEDDKVVEKASTTIKVPFIEVKPEPPVDSRDADDDESGKSKEDELASIPGFEVLPALIAIGVVLLLIRKNHKEK